MPISRTASRIGSWCGRSFLRSSREEHLQLLAADLRQHALILAEDRVGERALRRLQLEDLLLDRVPRDEPRRDHAPRLADAVRAVDRLRLDRRIPPRIEQEDVVGRGEVEAMAARLEADQEQRARSGRSGSDRRVLAGRASRRRGTRTGRRVGVEALRGRARGRS